MLSRLRTLLPIVGALGLFAGLALLDYVVPEGSWYAAHPMSAAALSSLIGFIAAGLLLEGWLKEREARRLERISTVAYRSLAQYANDAGRALLAPLNVADLYALGLPTALPGDAEACRARLRQLGHDVSFDQATGSWTALPAERRWILRDLMNDPSFVREMFRTTATMRRRLQEVTALWAPVMLSSKNYADDLGRLRELTDALELLQEHWRLSGLIGLEPGHWEVTAEWSQGLQEQFWSTISIYEHIRDDFGDLAKLPSDAIVRRRPR